MAKIIPICDLQKGAEISDFVNSSGEPIFVTCSGRIDMVILSMETYEKHTVYSDIIKSVEQVKKGTN